MRNSLIGKTFDSGSKNIGSNPDSSDFNNSILSKMIVSYKDCQFDITLNMINITNISLMYDIISNLLNYAIKHNLYDTQCKIISLNIHV